MLFAQESPQIRASVRSGLFLPCLPLVSTGWDSPACHLGNLHPSTIAIVGDRCWPKSPIKASGYRGTAESLRASPRVIPLRSTVRRSFAQDALVRRSFVT